MYPRLFLVLFIFTVIFPAIPLQAQDKPINNTEKHSDQEKKMMSTTDKFVSIMDQLPSQNLIQEIRGIKILQRDDNHLLELRVTGVYDAYRCIRSSVPVVEFINEYGEKSELLGKRVSIKQLVTNNRALCMKLTPCFDMEEWRIFELDLLFDNPNEGYTRKIFFDVEQMNSKRITLTVSWTNGSWHIDAQSVPIGSEMRNIPNENINLTPDQFVFSAESFQQINKIIKILDVTELKNGNSDSLNLRLRGVYKTASCEDDALPIFEFIPEYNQHFQYLGQRAKIKQLFTNTKALPIIEPQCKDSSHKDKQIFELDLNFADTYEGYEEMIHFDISGMQGIEQITLQVGWFNGKWEYSLNYSHEN
jgi:hypothetical protein